VVVAVAMAVAVVVVFFRLWFLCPDTPIHKYKKDGFSSVRRFFFPSQPSFVYLCCQKSDLSGPIHGYAYKMTTFLFVYSFFLFVA
jgi:hypothetical protein